MYYTCKYFRIEELVDKLTYEKFGELSWQFFDVNALKMIDGLREYFDTPMYINNWLWGGYYQFKGLRPPYSNVGADYSAHRLGKGFDPTFKGIEIDEIRNRIIIDQDHPLLKFINRIEANVSWLHADTMNIPDIQRIKIVYP